MEKPYQILTEVPLNYKCECEHGGCQHSREGRGCNNPAVGVFKFPGSGTFALCRTCWDQYNKPAMPVDDKLKQRMIDTDTLEALVDRHGLPQVVDMLADVCLEKSEHLASNWQDSNQARWWRGRASKLHKLVL